jgi:hypothetical protein
MKSRVRKSAMSTIMVQLNLSQAEELTTAALRLGLRRDAYLNNILPGEIALVEHLPANSELAELHASDLLTDTRQKKVAIRLNSRIVARLNKACAAKRIPRDAFCASFLRHVVRNLQFAADVLENPRSYWSDEGEPYRELVWTDEEIERWSAQVETVAQLKGVTFGEAQSALLRLDKSKRDRIFFSKEVKTRSDKILQQAKSDNPVDLSDLL